MYPWHALDPAEWHKRAKYNTVEEDSCAPVRTQVAMMMTLTEGNTCAKVQKKMMMMGDAAAAAAVASVEDDD